MSARRNLSTPESRAFWAGVERIAREVATWPPWKRAGINVAATRDELPSPGCQCCGKPLAYDGAIRCGAACTARHEGKRCRCYATGGAP